MAPHQSSTRSIEFWGASFLALSLSALSWASFHVIRKLNELVFHDIPQGTRGEWAYIAVRMLLTALLVWVVVRLPEDPKGTVATNTAARRTSGSRAKLFDPLMALRALACLFVLMGHYFFVFFSFSDGKLPFSTLALLRSSPWGGVWVFFTLSGFLMGKGFAAGRYSLDGKGMRMFLRNRLIRIAPVYYCGLLVVVIYRYPAMLHPDGLWMFFRICLFDFDGNFPINGIVALWSVTTEMQFYLLVPALAVLLLGLRNRWGRGFLIVPVVALLAGTALRFVLLHRYKSPFVSFYSPLMTNLDIFVAGMSISVWGVPKVSSARTKKVLDILLTVGIVAMYVGISLLTQHRGQMSMSMWFGNFLAKGPILCVLPALVYIYLAEMRGKVELRGGILSRFLLMVQGMGTLTYCIYVFHADVFQTNEGLLPTVRSLSVSLGQLPVVILETLLIALFFYFFVEKPFDIKKKVPGTALMDAP